MTWSICHLRDIYLLNFYFIVSPVTAWCFEEIKLSVLLCICSFMPSSMFTQARILAVNFITQA